MPVVKPRNMHIPSPDARLLVEVALGKASHNATRSLRDQFVSLQSTSADSIYGGWRIDRARNAWRHAVFVRGEECG